MNTPVIITSIYNIAWILHVVINPDKWEVDVDVSNGMATQLLYVLKGLHYASSLCFGSTIHN